MEHFSICIGSLKTQAARCCAPCLDVGHRDVEFFLFFCYWEVVVHMFRRWAKSSWLTLSWPKSICRISRSLLGNGGKMRRGFTSRLLWTNTAKVGRHQKVGIGGQPSYTKRWNQRNAILICASQKCHPEKKQDQMKSNQRSRVWPINQGSSCQTNGRNTCKYRITVSMRNFHQFILENMFQHGTSAMSHDVLHILLSSHFLVKVASLGLK